MAEATGVCAELAVQISCPARSREPGAPSITQHPYPPAAEAIAVGEFGLPAVSLGCNRLFPSILSAVGIVRPETVISWHRRGFQDYWRWKSRPGAGRTPIDGKRSDLIKQMSMANPLWGAPRIRGELLMLAPDRRGAVDHYQIHGAEVSAITVTELEDLVAQPCSRNCIGRSLCGAERVFQIALWSGDPEVTSVEG